MTHDFNDSLKKAQEEAIDRLLENLGYTCIRTGEKVDRQGVDRWILKKNVVEMVDYKCDYRVADTGNLPVEMYHVDEQTSERWDGWAYKPKAHTIIYFDCHNRIVFNVPQHVIQSHLEQWANRNLKVARTKKNDRFYQTFNAVIPVAEMLEIPEVTRITLEESLRDYRPKKHDWTKYLHQDLKFGDKIINPPDRDGIIRERRNDDVWRYAPGDKGYVQYRELFPGTKDLMRIDEFLSRNQKIWSIVNQDERTHIKIGKSVTPISYRSWMDTDRNTIEYTKNLGREIRRHLESRAKVLFVIEEYEKNLQI